MVRSQCRTECSQSPMDPLKRWRAGDAVGPVCAARMRPVATLGASGRTATPRPQTIFHKNMRDAAGHGEFPCRRRIHWFPHVHRRGLGQPQGACHCQEVGQYAG